MRSQITTTNSDQAFKEACALRGYDPAALLPDVSNLPDWLQRYTHSTIKRLIIVEAINDGRIRKRGERAYFPVWDLTDDSSGFGFSCAAFDSWATNSSVGPRLEFFSVEDAKFFGTNFMDLHQDILIVEQVPQNME